MSWDPCSFQISGKVCTLQWLKISDIDSSTPEVVSFQQCLTKEQKNARTHFWLDTPRMVLCCDANMFSQALEDQHGQLYIRESLSNIEQLDDWWKGNFVRSGRTSARGVPSFLTGSTVPRFHTRIAPICASKPAKIIPRSKNIKNLMQLVNVHEPDISSFSGVPRQVGKTGCKVILHDLPSLVKWLSRRFRFGQDDFSPKCTKSCALTRACPPVDLSTFKRSLLEM